MTITPFKVIQGEINLACYFFNYVVYLRQKSLNFVHALSCYKQKRKVVSFNLSQTVHIGLHRHRNTTPLGTTSDSSKVMANVNLAKLMNSSLCTRWSVIARRSLFCVWEMPICSDLSKPSKPGRKREKKYIQQHLRALILPTISPKISLRRGQSDFLAALQIPV